MAKCDGCGKETRWILTENQKWMMCERKEVFAEECEHGTALVGDDGKTIKVGYTEPEPGVSYYEPHWPKCSKADHFRTKEKVTRKQLQNVKQIMRGVGNA